ncbi:hypothetical protein McpAg1_00360 [Methanocorpusculaceae archaeon Ag1]|uniref:Uncharacterized protein n=2 Tax=Methanorbis furvi TaxID=3028299 RepID=A0AAE4MB14_9EURY|nr:hypothetical protein [Methanocorpusculaceae archaeon Ag1]
MPNTGGFRQGAFIMSDARIRLVSVIVLSLVAFSGIFGAALALLWWLVFCSRETFAKISWKLVLPVSILTAGFPGLVLTLTGSGDGFIYAAKIFALLLLAFWVGAARKSGEFLDLGVWAFGNRLGFDLGLTAELSMQFLAGIADDFSHMKTALTIKEQKLNTKTVPSLMLGVLLLSLARAKNVGSLLARRGYISGGTYIPSFSHARADNVKILCVACIAAVVFFSIAS